MGAIEGSRYAAEEERLKNDPIIQSMALEIIRDYRPPADIRDFWDRIVFEDGTPAWGFTTAASDEYRERGGIADTIGGPARAILALVRAFNTESSETPG